jgi:hypothetical protein
MSKNSVTSAAFGDTLLVSLLHGTRRQSVVTPHSAFSDTCYMIAPLASHTSQLHLLATFLSAAAQPRSVRADQLA